MANKKRRSKQPLTYIKKLDIIKKYETLKIKKKKNFTAKEKRLITNFYNKLKPALSKRTKFVKADKKTIANAKREGHKVTSKGVFITRPTTVSGAPIPGVRVSFTKRGITVISKGARRQYEAGFSEKEVSDILSEERYIEDIINEIVGRHPDLKKKFAASKTKTMKLVFGAYLGGEDIQGIEQLAAYINQMNVKSRALLTGIRFVFHEATRTTKDVTKKARKKRRKKK